VAGRRGPPARMLYRQDNVENHPRGRDSLPGLPRLRSGALWGTLALCAQVLVSWPGITRSVCAQPAATEAPALVPLDDAEVAVPFLPAGITRSVPESFGNYVYCWALADGTQVIQYYGDFTLHLGDRRLKSQDAVIWMQKGSWEGTSYYHFQVFLSQHAWVRDSAGTVTTGPTLFVTFNSFFPSVVEADVTTRAPSSDTPLYRDAWKVRQAVLARSTATQPAGLEVVDFDRPVARDRPKARPLVRHRANEEAYREEQGVVTAIGDVYVSQGLLDSADFLEIRADAAVLFLLQREKKTEKDLLDSSPDAGLVPASPSEESRQSQEASGLPGFSEEVGTAVAGAYLRGDVVLTRGERMVRASELYYDFENDRALILDAVMRANAPGNNLPIYVRASQVRQLSSTEYFARKARISTSEFYTSHVHLGAERVFLTDATPRDITGRIAGLEAGKYRAHDVTLNIEGVPIAYWPYTAGDFRRDVTSLRSVRTGYTDDFGATFESKWYLFNLLGLETPEGFDALLRLDYFSKRGPGVGMDLDYELDDSYGLFRGYYLHDTGKDDLGPFRDGELDTENRGRFTFRHRELLPKGWELTLEGSYICDPNFLEEYFNAEFEEGKEQETLIYLKKQQDNWAFTALAQWRVLDFLTQTEHLPDLGFHWIGEPLAEIASVFSESHLGLVRYRPDNRRLNDSYRIGDNTNKSDVVFRADSRNEIDFPIKLAGGRFNLVPFAMGRAGYWDDTPFDGSTDRLFGQIGVRGGTQLWRLYEDVSSQLLDLNGIRHIIKPEFTAWASASNKDSLDLYPFDAGVEDIDDFYGTSLALRQRWQTKRGGPGKWRVVDWITLDLELNLFGDSPQYGLPLGRFYESRPENSVARNHIRADFMCRISDTTAILADGNFDLNDGNMDLLNISYAVERTPRFSYAIGYRRIHDTNSDLLGFGANYKINTKHRIAIRTFYDIERNKTESFDITIVRKFPRWYAAVTLGVDKIEDDISIGLSLWPEGAPQAALGSRKYTGLSRSTGIRTED